MKKIFFILSLLFVTSIGLFAQEDDENEGNDKIRDKMSEFIRKRLNLSKDEAEKFTPVFLRYFREWRQTLKENRGIPKLDLQEKIVDLRIRYRTQFREILGEQRGNQIFHHQDIFIRELQDIRKNRLRNNPTRPINRPRVNKLL